MQRHHSILRKGKSWMKDINRQEWCTYESFNNMYGSVYETMVKAGVATKLEEAVWFNHDGNIVPNKEQAIGEKLKYFLQHP